MEKNKPAESVSFFLFFLFFFLSFFEIDGLVQEFVEVREDVMKTRSWNNAVVSWCYDKQAGRKVEEDRGETYGESGKKEEVPSYSIPCLCFAALCLKKNCDSDRWSRQL